MDTVAYRTILAETISIKLQLYSPHKRIPAVF